MVRTRRRPTIGSSANNMMSGSPNSDTSVQKLRHNTTTPSARASTSALRRVDTISRNNGGSNRVISCLLLSLVALTLMIMTTITTPVCGFHVHPTTIATARTHQNHVSSPSNLHQHGRGNLIVSTTIVSSPSFPTSSSGGGVASSSTELSMFMGSDGGILGIGGPELATILLVGYFILGPSDLYKLVKEIGKFIQNARTLSTDLTTTFEQNMESNLQLEELRKAQRELNDAFSFRRSINVDADADAFATTVDTPRPGLREGDVPPIELQAATATAAAATTGADAAPTTVADKPKKKKIRRRKRVVTTPDPATMEGNVPDLEMPVTQEASSTGTAMAAAPTQPNYTDEELALIDQEFDQYVSPSDSSASAAASWFTEDDDEATKTISSTPKPEPLTQQQSTTTASAGASSPPAPAASATAAVDEAEMNAAALRFQQQMSGNWNEQILQNEDKLSPVAQVMQKIALLEEEKMAATRRLEEEFAKRTEIEEKYYQEQRKLLEEAANQIQQDAMQRSA